MLQGRQIPQMRVMAMPIMLHSQEGEGEEEEATEAVAGAVEVGAVGLVLVTHRVVEEDGGWPRRWRTREQSSKLLRTTDLVEQGRVIVGFWSLVL